MDLSYIINELGEDRENYYRSVSPPIMMSSNFCFDNIKDMQESLEFEHEIPFYTRGVNPTTAILQKKIAALEKTEDALIFASGSAAIGAAVMANLSQGDHVVCVEKPYSWTNKLLNQLLPRFGVTATMVDGTDPKNYERAIRPSTKILYLESPNSWTFELQDIEAVVKIAKKHGLLTIIDNSYASPINMNPAEMGVDIVTHSASKYLNGHSDLVAGVLCATKEMTTRIFKSEFMTFGGIISPMNAWLMLRGLRTLPIRMERAEKSTATIIDFLANHEKVGKIYYPFHPSHPQYELAKRQMKQGTGQFTIQLKTEKPDEIIRFCDSLKTFYLACSWGGHESLIFPAVAMVESMNYKNATTPLNMIRFYVGLEETDYLIADLKQAFDKI
ncbi:MAG: aminotransferase class I/II-fold pyridoxal phosphate-dependent enzyme [Imperialibacter sp.]|uniref:trans-sulfuration enzyme family protein n=1 Tax=Imperialibacter sp. TaxID=2038411 RepID=UPI0032EB2968